MSKLIPNPKTYADGVIAGVAYSVLVVVTLFTALLLYVGWHE